MSNTNSKKPRPYVKPCSQEDLNWDPVCREQFTVNDGVLTRAGDSFAVCRSNTPNERWRVEVEAMVERSRNAQAALTDLLVAADKFVLGDADRSLIAALGLKPAGKEWGITLLDTMVRYHKGGNKDITWGVWERRLNDDAIMAMVKVLGVKKFGVALDMALGGNRYGKKATDEARKAALATAA